MTEEVKESILKRIQKLLKMSEDKGASENEAMLAAKKAQELLSEHNLSRSDIKDDSQVENIERETFDAERENWQGWIQSATAKLYFCQYFSKTGFDSNYKRINQAVFVGRKSNRIVAKSMCDYFINTVKRLADKEFESVPGSKSAINKMKRAFILGCATRLQKRINERFNEIAPPYEGIQNPDSLPMLYQNEQKAITDWLRNQGVRVVQKKSSFNVRDREAYSRGKQKGNGIGLDTQVNNQTRSRMLGR
jgi:hypothetical protein